MLAADKRLNARSGRLAFPKGADADMTDAELRAAGLTAQLVNSRPML